MNNILNLIILTVGGLAGGSFAACMVTRYVHHQSPWGRSACEHCHHQLTWWQLIPVVGVLIQRGRCAWCHQPISWQSTGSELACAGIILAEWWCTKLPPVHLIILVTWLAILTGEDAATQTVCPGMLWGGTLLLGTLTLPVVLTTIRLHPGFILLLLGPLLALAWRRQLGSADVVLTGAMALLYGPRFACTVLFGAAGAALLAFLLRRSRRSLPFIPFLAGALLISLAVFH